MTGFGEGNNGGSRTSDGLVRETFNLPRAEAREKAKSWLKTFPPAACWSRVENWEELTEDHIRFTMVRLPTAD